MVFSLLKKTIYIQHTYILTYKKSGKININRIKNNLFITCKLTQIIRKYLCLISLNNIKTINHFFLLLLFFFFRWLYSHVGHRHVNTIIGSKIFLTIIPMVYSLEAHTGAVVRDVFICEILSVSLLFVMFDLSSLSRTNIQFTN